GNAAAGAAGGAAAKRGKKGEKDDLMKLVTAIGRLVLAQARAVADLAAVVYVTFMMPLSRGLPAAMRAAGKKYEEGSKAMKESGASQEHFKKRGPPRIHVFLAAFQCVAKQVWENTIVSSEMETIAEAVLCFRLKPLRKEEGVEQQRLVITNFNKDTKLALARRPYIMNVLQYEGATAVHGSAPRGPLEREIAKM
ncbi:unnamed protein product, partial [Prorocentrum cordatum]